MVPPPTSTTSTTHARPELRRFLRRVRAEPGVERRLRLFEQRDVFQSGPLRRLGGELAGDVVERSRHGDDDLAFFQSIVRPCGPVPDSRHRRGAAGTSPRRRAARAAARPAAHPRQQGSGAIHARMAEPRLGTRHLPAGDLGPVVAGERADDVHRFVVPRQGRGPGGQIVRSGQVQKRRQQRQCRISPGATSCGTGNGCSVGPPRPDFSVRSTYAIAQFVVPRSMPTKNRGISQSPMVERSESRNFDNRLSDCVFSF